MYLSQIFLICLALLIHSTTSFDCGCDWCNGDCCCNGNCNLPGAPCPPGLFSGGFVQPGNNGGGGMMPNPQMPAASNRIPGGDFANPNFPSFPNPGFIPNPVSNGQIPPPFQPQGSPPPNQLPPPFQPQTGLGPAPIPQQPFVPAQLPVLPPPTPVNAPEPPHQPQPMTPIGPLRPQNNRNGGPQYPNQNNFNGGGQSGINYASDSGLKDSKHAPERLRRKRRDSKNQWSYVNED